mmetsp:Transcript_40555/g.122475  ORF Transcript_40555/g.122475 Transcript_40555/m.122475 type:complete len:204 (-) Transcript_40555:116-727(-)
MGSGTSTSIFPWTRRVRPTWPTPRSRRRRSGCSRSGWRRPSPCCASHSSTTCAKECLSPWSARRSMSSSRAWCSSPRGPTATTSTAGCWTCAIRRRQGAGRCPSRPSPTGGSAWRSRSRPATPMPSASAAPAWRCTTTSRSCGRWRPSPFSRSRRTQARKSAICASTNSSRNSSPATPLSLHTRSLDRTTGSSSTCRGSRGRR